MKSQVEVIQDPVAVNRTLMGPGPSDIDPRVLAAMARPCIGHLDPFFLSIMDDTQDLLRYVFQTANSLTIPVSGTGSAGMETCFVNFVDPGDEVAVCVNGVFGSRMCELVRKAQGKLTMVEEDWGRAVDPNKVREALKGKTPKILAVVHAETSTGACQRLSELSSVAKDCGALFLVDTVTSLGGIEVKVDDHGIDIVYSGTQKCLSCPPGLSPVSFSDRAMDVLNYRKTEVPSWYFDMNLVKNYWGDDRTYHHTAPVNMIFALHEALQLIQEEGLEARFKRHRLNHEALVAGVEAMGLSMYVPEAERLPMLNAIAIPEGIDDVKVRKALLHHYGIEIGGGLGPLAGKIWRVGLMGHSSSRKNVILFLSALEATLGSEGFKLSPGSAIRAATEVYANAT